MHQNRQMWGRLQLAGTLQAGLLGAAYVLHTFKSPTLTLLACAAAFTATAALIHITSVDRAIRDKYRDKLTLFGVSIGFHSDKPDDMQRYNRASFGLNFLDSKFYMNAILVFLMGLDIAALIVLLSRQIT
jgi:hypothetical protein